MVAPMVVKLVYEMAVKLAVDSDVVQVVLKVN
jgi:hypothetical protein